MNGKCPAPGRCGVPNTGVDSAPVGPLRAGTPGSEFSLGNLLEDDLVDGQFRHGLLKPGILCLEFLQAFRLINLQTTVALAPAVVRPVGYPDLLAGVGDAPTLPEQDIRLTQLVDDLLRGVFSPGYVPVSFPS